MLAAALIATASVATVQAAAVAASPSTHNEARGVSLGRLLTANDNPTGYVYIETLQLGQDLGVDGKSVYVGKDDNGVQLFQFADGAVAPLSFTPGETQDIPVKNNLCQGCQPSSGHAKREVSIRDLAASIGGTGDGNQAGNADFGDSINIGDEIGEQVGLDGAKYVGKDDDGVQLFQFKDGSVAPIVLTAGEVAQGYEFDESTGLCKGCTNSSGWSQKRSVQEELELAEREAEGKYEVVVARHEQHEERFLLSFLGLLGLKCAIGKSLFFGPGRWGGNVAHGGYINIRGCQPGTNIGIRNGVYAGCNPRGVQMYNFPGYGVAPLRCSKGPVREGWTVNSSGYCSSCHHRGWYDSWWKKDVIVEEERDADAESTEVSERTTQPEHEERFLFTLLGLAALKIKVGSALLLGKGRVGAYWAHGGYINIPRCRPGTHIGVNDGVYVGCNRDGVQLFKWGQQGGVGPLRCSRGPVRQGCTVRGNLCDVCHHDGQWNWNSEDRWSRDVDASQINELD